MDRDEPDAGPFELVVPLSGRAFPTRAARVEIRRFVASRAVALVHRSADIVDEAVRRALAAGADGLVMSASVADDSLIVELSDRNGCVGAVADDFPLLRMRAERWSRRTGPDGGTLRFELDTPG